MKHHGKEIHTLPITQTSKHFVGKMSFEQRLKCDRDDQRAIKHYYIPKDIKAKDLEQLQAKEKSETLKTKKEFDELYRNWFEATAHLSSLKHQTSHLSFLRMIKMGDKALPFILEEFRKLPIPGLMTALEVFAEEDIASDAASYSEAIERWIKWGKDNRYIE